MLITKYITEEDASLPESGFTLLELLITTSLIGILATLSMGLLVEYRQKAYRINVQQFAHDIDTASYFMRDVLHEAYDRGVYGMCNIDITNKVAASFGGSAEVDIACDKLLALVKPDSKLMGGVFISMSTVVGGNSYYSFNAYVGYCGMHAFENDRDLQAIPTYMRSLLEIDGTSTYVNTDWTWVEGTGSIVPGEGCVGHFTY